MSGEEVCGDEEADEVDDNYDTDDEVEINKLGCKDEQSVGVEFCSQEAVVLAHIWQDGVT